MARGPIKTSYLYVVDHTRRPVHGPYVNGPGVMEDLIVIGHAPENIITSPYRLKTVDERNKIRELRRQLEKPKGRIGRVQKIDDSRPYGIMDLRTGTIIYTGSKYADAQRVLSKLVDEDLKIINEIRKISGKSVKLPSPAVRSATAKKYYKTYGF